MDKDHLSIKVQMALKRSVDLLIAVGGLVILLPLIAFIALAVKLDSPGPVLYRHRRIGKNGIAFNLLKFRSMVSGGDDSGYMRYLSNLIQSERDGNGNPLPYRKMEGDPRVTRVGRFLRRYYLDELPQMWNILVGEMSLVGPRPHVQFEVDHYSPEQRRRLISRPGATGLWQVTGKGDATFSELIQLDLTYIDDWNLWLDVRIIARTVVVMLRGGEEFWARMRKRIPRRLDRPGARRHAVEALLPVTAGSHPVLDTTPAPPSPTGSPGQDPVEDEFGYSTPS